MLLYDPAAAAAATIHSPTAAAHLLPPNKPYPGSSLWKSVPCTEAPAPGVQRPSRWRAAAGATSSNSSTTKRPVVQSEQAGCVGNTVRACKQRYSKKRHSKHSVHLECGLTAISHPMARGCQSPVRLLQLVVECKLVFGHLGCL